MNATHTQHRQPPPVQCRVVATGLGITPPAHQDVDLGHELMDRVDWGQPLVPPCHLAHLLTTMDLVQPPGALVEMDTEQAAG